jgi:hypothetical protein
MRGTLAIRKRNEKLANILTWNGHEKLDCIPVSVEGKLRLRHGAVGDEASRHHPFLYST